MSKYESARYLCTLFDIQCCQSVIMKVVYGFMCRLDSPGYIIKDILATRLRYTSRIRKHWCSLLGIGKAKCPNKNCLKNQLFLVCQFCIID